jgi:hypothetical protein
MELACLKYFQPGFDSNNPLPFGLTFELKITHRPAGNHKFVSSVCCVYCINRVVSLIMILLQIKMRLSLIRLVFFACYALHIRSVFVTTTKNISPNSIIIYPDAAKENCTPDLQQVKLLDKITIPCRPDNFFSAKQGIFTVKYLKIRSLLEQYRQIYSSARHATSLTPKL